MSASKDLLFKHVHQTGWFAPRFRALHALGRYILTRLQSSVGVWRTAYRYFAPEDPSSEHDMGRSIKDAGTSRASSQVPQKDGHLVFEAGFFIDLRIRTTSCRLQTDASGHRKPPICTKRRVDSVRATAASKSEARTSAAKSAPGAGLESGDHLATRKCQWSRSRL